jgi:hypothetical protein
VSEFFWGLWLFPLGWLVHRSRFLPRLLGAWLIVNGFAYLALSISALLAPSYASLIFKLAMPALFGELGLALWLAARGIRTVPTRAAAPTA